MSSFVVLGTQTGGVIMWGRLVAGVAEVVAEVIREKKAKKDSSKGEGKQGNGSKS
jgi:hypothetical protein